MKNNKNITSRRSFLTFKKSGAVEEKGGGFRNHSEQGDSKINDKIKMLTSDGQLVEVDRSALKNAAKTKVSNKDIMNWSKNKSFQNP